MILMADSVNVQHKLQMLFETKLDEKSKQQVGKQIKGMLENSVISFDESEAKRNLESVIRTLNKLFSKAEMEGFDTEKLLKMPSLQALQEMANKTTQDFQDAFDKALKKSGGIKIDFGNADLSDMTMPLKQMAQELADIGERVASSTKKSVSEIEASFKSLKTDKKISGAAKEIDKLLTQIEAKKFKVSDKVEDAISNLVTLRDNLAKSKMDSDPWEKQYQHLLKYVGAYEAAQKKFGESLVTDNPQLQSLYEMLSPKAKTVKVSLENFVNMARGDDLVEDKRKPWAREKTLQEVKQVLKNGITVNGKTEESSGGESPSSHELKPDEPPKPTPKPKPQKTKDPITEGINKFIKEYTAGIEALFDAPVEEWNKLRQNMMAKLSETFKIKADVQANDLLKNFELFELNEDEKKLTKYLKEQIEAPILADTKSTTESKKKTINKVKPINDEQLGDDSKKPSGIVTIDENSLKNVLADITYKVKVEGEDKKESSEDNQIVSTLGEISQKIDSISKEETLQAIKGAVESKDVGGSASIGDESIPSAELTEQEKLVEQYNQNKQKTVELLKKEQLSYEEILYLVKEIQTEYASAFYKDKNYDLGDDASGLMTSVYGKLRRGDMIDARLDKAINGVGMTAEEGARILTDFQNRQSGIMDDISKKIQNIEDDDAESIEKENGTLEDKLERLQELSDAWGQKITQAKRDRYEALNQKEMNSGLTDKEEDRMSELFEEIESADASLEEFGETYDKIILKLANGKKVDILPDDSGLGKLFKFGDEYGESYNGVEIEDVIFERVKKAVDVIEDNMLQEPPSEKDKSDTADIEALKSALGEITYNVNIIKDNNNEDNQVVQILGEISQKIDAVSKDETLLGIKSTVETVLTQKGASSDSGIATEAIETTTSAMDALIEKAAQYASVQEFERANMKDLIAAGVKSRKVSSEIWKQGKLLSFSPIELTKEDAIAILREKVPDNILEGWFRRGDAEYKSILEQLALSDNDIRNAALNIMWDNYKDSTGKKIGFEDFLHSDIPMYRGKNSEKYVEGDETLAFTFDPKIAEKFGKYVLETLIKPIDTLGSYQTTGESEALVYRKSLESRPEYNQWHEAMANKAEPQMVKPIVDAIKDNLSTQERPSNEGKSDTGLEALKGVLSGITYNVNVVKDDDTNKVAIDTEALKGVLNSITYNVKVLNDDTKPLNIQDIESQAFALYKKEHPLVENMNGISDMVGTEAVNYALRVLGVSLDQLASEVDKNLVKAWGTLAPDAHHYMTSADNISPAALAGAILDTYKSLNLGESKIYPLARAKEINKSGVYSTQSISQDQVAIDEMELENVLSRITYNVKVVHDADAPDSEKAALIDTEALKTILGAITYNVKIAHDDTDKNVNKIALDDSTLEPILTRVFANILNPKTAEGSKSPYSEMPRNEATQYIADNYNHEVWDNWYSKALDPFRTQIAQTLENDIKLRNAALNQMWDEYKHLTGSDVSFEDFLNTKIPLYRGEGPEGKSQAERALSFSLSPETAKEFGENVLRVWLRPMDTLGMANPTYVNQPEAEVLIPKEAVPGYDKWREGLQSGADTTINAPWAREDTLGTVKGVLENIQANTAKIGTPETQQTVTIDAGSISSISEALAAIQAATKSIDGKVAKGVKANASSIKTSKPQKTAKFKVPQEYAELIRLKQLEYKLEKQYEKAKDGSTEKGYYKSQLDVIRKTIDAQKIKHKNDEQELKLAKMREDAEREIGAIRAKQADKSLKDEIKQSEEEARMSKARGIKGKAIDSITNVSLLSGISKEDQKRITKDLLGDLKAFNDLRVRIQSGDKTIGDKEIDAFKELQVKINNASKELNEFAALQDLVQSGEAIRIGENVQLNSANIESYRQALEAAVRTQYAGKATVGDFDYTTKQLHFTVNNGRREVTEYKMAWDKVMQTYVAMPGKTKKVESTLKKILNKAKEFGAYFTGSSLIYKGWNALVKGIQYVREIDKALTELKKVTDETAESYDRFLDKAAKTADKVGSTVSNIVSSTADWARIGYSLKEAASLAESTAILLNVSEFSNIEDATSALTSTLQAFGYTAEQGMDVVDVLNEVKVTCLLIQ